MGRSTRDPVRVAPLFTGTKVRVWELLKQLAEIDECFAHHGTVLGEKSIVHALIDTVLGHAEAA